MAIPVPLSVTELRAFVKQITDHSRPTTDAEIIEALNYGYDKAIKALLAVRSQIFLSVADPFTLVGGIQNYDLSQFDPPLWRPMRLLVAGSGSTRAIRFRYKSLVDLEFEDREASFGGTFSTFAYDILEGVFPQTPTTATAASSTTVTVASAAAFSLGSVIQVPGSGPIATLTGQAQTYKQTYFGVVTGVAGNVLTVAPNFVTNPPNGTAVIPVWRRMMRLAPAPNAGFAGQLFYQYRPAKLATVNDLIDPMIAEHRTLVTYYACAQLLRATNDAEATAWFQEAQGLRSELMQDADPLSMQNTEALGSDLYTVE